MSTSLPNLQSLANAIAQQEGYGAGNNIPTVANNPGSLELGDQGYGTLSAAGGQQITVFGSIEDGYNALLNQLSLAVNGQSANYSPNATLSQFGTTYSGGNTSYGNSLAQIMGVAPSTTLAQLAGGTTTSGGAGATQSTTPTSITGTILNNLNPLATPQPFSGALGTILNNLNPFAAPKAFGSTTTIARSVVLVLGVILFAAGLFAFKTTQTVIQNTTAAVKKGAQVAAAAGAE
jgi:hypothetical protein